MGKEVSKLIDGVQNEGKHEIIFNGDNLSSGVYFYVLTTENNSIVNKMSLLK